MDQLQGSDTSPLIGTWVTSEMKLKRQRGLIDPESMPKERWTVRASGSCTDADCDLLVSGSAEGLFAMRTREARVWRASRRALGDCVRDRHQRPNRVIVRDGYRIRQRIRMTVPPGQATGRLKARLLVREAWTATDQARRDGCRASGTATYRGTATKN